MAVKQQKMQFLPACISGAILLLLLSLMASNTTYAVPLNLFFRWARYIMVPVFLLCTILLSGKLGREGKLYLPPVLFAAGAAILYVVRVAYYYEMTGRMMQAAPESIPGMMENIVLTANLLTAAAAFCCFSTLICFYLKLRKKEVK